MKQLRVLLAGESWVSSSTHYKGWDFFSSTVYETGVHYLRKALVEQGIEFVHMPGHEAAEQFPATIEELQPYDVVMLSDIGANTLLLHPDTWARGKPTPNRLKLVREWVSQGGSLVMCGGYYSFAGIYGQAKYYRTPIEEILPVKIHTFDDRVEMPEGAVPEVVMPDHPIFTGIQGEWPYLLGYNELTLKDGSELLAQIGEQPFIAARAYGQGRTLIWSSDIGPHWCPEPFVTWEYFAPLWGNIIHWLAER
jgi:uncharacterized membrane protein